MPALGWGWRVEDGLASNCFAEGRGGGVGCTGDETNEHHVSLVAVRLLILVGGLVYIGILTVSVASNKS